MKKILLLISALGLCGVAMAKLPAPSEEAKAKAAEADALRVYGQRRLEENWLRSMQDRHPFAEYVPMSAKTPRDVHACIVASGGKQRGIHIHGIGIKHERC